MKRIKRIASLMLAMVMALGMSATVFATEDTHETNSHTITITETSNDGYEYEVYRIFKGDIFTKKQEDETITKTLSNIEWDENCVNGTAVLETLQDATKGIGDFQEKNTDGSFKVKTAADVASVLSQITDDEKIDKFSEIVGSHLKNKVGATWTKTGTAPKITYQTTVTGDGYYFVKNSKTPDAIQNPDGSSTGYSETRYILQVLGDVTVKAKADAPHVDKNIYSTDPICGNEESEHEHTASCYRTKYNNGAIGDTVNFVADSNVPNMDGYQSYFFIMRDTLPQGLSFAGNVTVSVGGEELKCNTIPSENDGVERDKNSYYVKLYDKDDKLIVGKPSELTAEQMDSVVAFEIVFENFIQYKEQAGAAIEVHYSAVINEDVKVGPSGEINKLKLIYSKNPNEAGEGKPDEPDYPSPDKPQGETPDSETVTYTTGIQLQKFDGSTNTPLAGAQFTIKANVLNKFWVNITSYEENENGDYYLLKDGTYTKVAPVFNKEDATKDTSKYYDNIENGVVTKKYVLKTESKVEEQKTVNNEKTYTAYVDANGVLNLEGLAAGTYTITEIKAPNGYNMLDGDITIVIDWEKPAGNDVEKKCIWSVVRKGAPDVNLELGDENGKEVVEGEEVSNGKKDNTKLYILPIANYSGSLLPSTGGIGTTIFYVVGAILVIGAGILLVAKKRMSKN